MGPTLSAAQKFLSQRRKHLFSLVYRFSNRWREWRGECVRMRPGFLLRGQRLSSDERELHSPERDENVCRSLRAGRLRRTSAPPRCASIKARAAPRPRQRENPHNIVTNFHLRSHVFLASSKEHPSLLDPRHRASKFVVRAYRRNDVSQYQGFGICVPSFHAVSRGLGLASATQPCLVNANGRTKALFDVFPILCKVYTCDLEVMPKQLPVLRRAT